MADEITANRKKMIMEIYDKFGVRRVVNAAGPKTRLSGSIMPREVIEAMMEASRSFVEMESLQAKASEVISRITGAEAGLVTSGAAAGLSLAAAACLTGLDIAKMDQLPDTSNMKNEFVIARHQRNAYDHAIRAVGARLVEAGLNDKGVGVGVRGVEPWEFVSAITEKTVAIVYFAKSRSTPPLAEVIKIGRQYSIPVIVDAAAELPPVTNLKSFISRGADVVVFSGGKDIRGPQASGIICGKRDLIMAAALQMLDMDCRFETWNPPLEFIDKSKLTGIPRHGIGRGFKVGKEEIVGLMTALKIYSEKNEEEELRKYDKMAQYFAQAMIDTQGIDALYLPRTQNRMVPLTEIKFTNCNNISDMVNIIQELRLSNPPIFMDESRVDEMVLQLNPFNLRDGDIDFIVQCLKGLSKADRLSS
jgi:L-seryl-tRNA(Ser) seleniumtransferase